MDNIDSKLNEIINARKNIDKSNNAFNVYISSLCSVAFIAYILIIGFVLYLLTNYNLKISEEENISFLFVSVKNMSFIAYSLIGLFTFAACLECYTNIDSFKNGIFNFFKNIKKRKEIKKIEEEKNKYFSLINGLTNEELVKLIEKFIHESCDNRIKYDLKRRLETITEKNKRKLEDLKKLKEQAEILNLDSNILDKEKIIKIENKLQIQSD